MTAKTISIDAHAYALLNRARKSQDESFSQVIKRAQWPRQDRSCGALLKALSKMPRASATVMQRLDAAQMADSPPDSAWA